MVETHIVHDPDGPDIQFEGELIAEQQSAQLGNVKVYRTRSGKLVVAQHRNRVRQSPAISRVAVFDEMDELPKWLGHSLSAKSLMDELGYPVRRIVE
ncbi:hypothetical protein ACLIR7_05760 [Nitratireductor aquimarinus]|uniref:hypothetical protein n=1 Tax=Nitratireductor aquimarinus TaxID=889300 RepID=UPI00398E4115